ncbi:lipoate--protein ligase family protein [Brevibacillus daliensis]|uniref:lipoate--protein ligase family protein n=1 Tax=Brevibacillus daliensis TaxID=2892995 RepID=UPI001E4F56A0|nr:lipoate--protein ligase family protein [Brevibacillus daliensis]
MTQLDSTTFTWIDSGVYRGTPVEPIAMDEALATAMGQPDATPIIHLWVYDKAFYLGRRDAKLPHLEETLRTYSKQGYSALLRSSGGACVPLDAGVLNMAILFPSCQLTIEELYKLVATMLQVGLQDYGQIEVGEVLDSYCVGDYDFAFDGKKIGGMAQRRTRHGSILQLCINVEGSGLERGKLMEEFYQQAGLYEMEKASRPVPAVRKETIGSISEHLGRPISVEEVKDRLFEAFITQWRATKGPLFLSKEQKATAIQHLTGRLGLFSYTAEEINLPTWILQK